MMGRRDQGMKRRIAFEVSRTFALYGFAGWVYIALVALVHPHTLGLQLTHFWKFPHEDTFGEVCFVVSAVSFFVCNLMRSPGKDVGPLSRSDMRP
jgi:hypothetical protein